ncbi:hypothetical protein BU15DRAFT_82550 [Melanogaster broomeanus]|nr:hypothetical protein BU15DRAFT_82550 [Melanogaster broomeanus]
MVSVIAQHLLDSTKSQLTYYSLFQLASSIEPGSLVALFHNSHLSVLYKSEEDTPALCSFVTDSVFLNEMPNISRTKDDLAPDVTNYTT